MLKISIDCIIPYSIRYKNFICKIYKFKKISSEKEEEEENE